MKFSIFSLLLALFSYRFLDKGCALFFHSPPPFVTLVSSLISLLTTPFLYLGAGAFIFLYTKRKEVFSVTSLTYLLAGTLKVLFARARPYLFIEKGLYGFYPGTFSSQYRSFPSAHTAMIVAVLTFFSLQRKISSRWWIIPLIIGISRICLGKHYMSDIFVGAFVGSLSGYLVYLWEKKKADKKVFCPPQE